ncbi:FixH family protein [Phenylobacterium sp.]|uniref:FixH family protein n=1 Tax=Phenylobacterium sp. TaxID=1871053 RepID=UPI002FD9706A
MSLTHDTDAGFRIKGWHVLVAMIAFFAVITAVNAVFITAALRTFPGEVSVTPYEDGLAYNARLAQQAAQAELGWRAAAAAMVDGVEVQLVDSQGHPLTGLEVTALLQRPATETGAQTLALSETAPGVYGAQAHALAGVWDLTFKAVAPGGQTFEAQRRLTWP